MIASWASSYPGERCVERFQPIDVLRTGGVEEIVVSTAVDAPELLRLICCGENGLALRERNDLVSIAVDDQQRHVHLSNFRASVVPTREHRSQKWNHFGCHPA